MSAVCVCVCVRVCVRVWNVCSLSPSQALGIYKELSKAKLSALVVTSTLMGYWMAGGPVRSSLSPFSEKPNKKQNKE